MDDGLGTLKWVNLFMYRDLDSVIDGSYQWASLEVVFESVKMLPLSPLW